MTYPKLGIYNAGNDYFGAPLVLPTAGYPLNLAMVNEWAKWDHIALDSPWAHRADLIAQLKKYNPNAKVYCKIALDQIYFNSMHTIDAANDIRKRIFDAIKVVPALDGVNSAGFLWSFCYTPARGFAAGPDFFNPDTLHFGRPSITSHDPSTAGFSLWNLNLASPAAVTAYAAVINKYVVPLFDGIIFDFSPHSIVYASGQGISHPFNVKDATTPDLWGSGWNKDVINAALAGSFTQDDTGGIAFDNAYKAGHQTLMQLIRSAAPRDFVLSLNDGGAADPTEYGTVNGSMTENWPVQGAGTWLGNMTGSGVYPGQFSHDRRFRQPQLSWFNTLPQILYGGIYGDDFTAVDNLQKWRYTLASATLTEAVANMTINTTPSTDTGYLVWFPENSVDIVSGKATGDTSKKGWLGDAFTNAYQTGSALDVWRRDFRNGIVLVNPNGTSRTVSLGGTFNRIVSGIVGDAVNVGGAVSSITIAATDAIFLIDPTPLIAMSSHNR